VHKNDQNVPAKELQLITSLTTLWYRLH